MVVAITTVLTGEAADWVADLHSDHARELVDVGLFLDALRQWFEDDTWIQLVERPGGFEAERETGERIRKGIQTVSWKVANLARTPFGAPFPVGLR